jgi:hypothetical protein
MIRPCAVAVVNLSFIEIACPLSRSSCTKMLSAIPAGHSQEMMGPIATYFEHRAHENTAKSRAILVKADEVVDSLGLDDELVDRSLVKLGLQ